MIQITKNSCKLAENKKIYQKFFHHIQLSFLISIFDLSMQNSAKNVSNSFDDEQRDSRIVMRA